MLTVLALALLGQADGYEVVERKAALTLESRTVSGSRFAELRVTADVAGSAKAMCEKTYGTGAFNADEPHLVARKVLREGDGERVTYEQIAPPFVSHRDYAVRRLKRVSSDGVCTVSFEADDAEAPPPVKGWVRIRQLKGAFVFTQRDAGAVHVVHTVHMDPAGDVPAWMVEPTRRAMAIAWLERVTRP